MRILRVALLKPLKLMWGLCFTSRGFCHPPQKAVQKLRVPLSRRMAWDGHKFPLGCWKCFPRGEWARKRLTLSLVCTLLILILTNSYFTSIWAKEGSRNNLICAKKHILSIKQLHCALIIPLLQRIKTCMFPIKITVWVHTEVSSQHQFSVV